MEEKMPTNLLPIHQLASIFVFFASMLALNPVRAEKNVDYINKLADEAKITNMTNKKSIPGKAPKPEPEPEQGNNIDDIRNVVNEAMANSKTKQKHTIDTENPKSLPKALNQIIEDNKGLTLGDDLKDNYIRSLSKELAELPKLKNPPALIRPSNKQKNKPNILSAKQLNSDKTITVLQDESLSKIAKRVYGNGNFYLLLYKANRDTIKNPNVIKVGQILKLPELPIKTRMKYTR